MRMRLVGYSGDRPPVPATSAVEPIDPNPDGGVPTDPPSPLVLSLADGVPFLKADYLALGYNRFEVMCFGAAGGAAGGFKVVGLTETGHRKATMTWGGKGGGGGVHRIKGRLTLLSSSTPVVVGAAGADAPFLDLPDNTAAWPNLGMGGDGGYSSFGGTICRASGGKGGKSYEPNQRAGGNPNWNGSASRGGVGNSLIAGGGGIPGDYGGFVDLVWDAGLGRYTGGHYVEHGGKWDGTIGEGGAGGTAGITDVYEGGNFDGGPIANSAWGGGPGIRGAYSDNEPTTSGPPDPSDHDFYTQPGYPTLQLLDCIPGWGGGAKAFLLNGENVQYGSRAEGRPGTGAVMIRLTYVVV